MSEELPDRHAAQATGAHPAPCARHCEANAYEIEIRRLRTGIELLRRELEFSNTTIERLKAPVDMEPVACITGMGGLAFSYQATYEPKSTSDLLYSHEQLATLQAENERLKAEIKLAFDDDNKMAALLEQEQEITKLTAERDACAELCETSGAEHWSECAAAIRARSR